MAASASQLVVDGHAVKITNPDKVMYPATGMTKGEVIDYYRQVAPWLIAHASARPCTRKRWPNGVGTPSEPEQSFFHKNLDAASTPDWVHTYTIEHASGANTYPLLDNPATLVWLAQLASLELHVPQWRVGLNGRPANPDRLVFDLDPGDGASMAQVVEVAQLIREVLDDLGLPNVPVTSGSKGIHLYAGLNGELTSEQATAWARELANSLQSAHPKLVVANMAKAARTGKVLLDWSQNNPAKTTVAPYSLRGRELPTVAAPRHWDEITEQVAQLRFDEVLERLATIGDPLDGLTDAEPAKLEVRQAPIELPQVEPMLATAGQASDVTGDDWCFEVKWDGYRAVASVSAGRVQLRSRGGLEFADKYPELAELAGLVGEHAAVLDGEIVALDAQGRPQFELLQNHASRPGSAQYMAFDLLNLDGTSWLRRPYLERRERLIELLGAGSAHVHVPDDLGTDAAAALAASAELGLEGVVAKKADSVYQPGRRGRTWVKIKHIRSQDVVIVGWTPGENARARTLGALLMAVPEADELAYVGRVGSGFTERDLSQALAILTEIEVSKPPLKGVPRTDAKGARWVEPLLVGEVSYGERAGSGRLRFPVWRGWRPDRHAEDVAWED